ncbi:hypothetical protein Leryth_006800 [Lithospermum erythrorhizon]|nr:hypothetical protein Leryth_006800 [Lithospermum erythrorhizon]
MSISSSPFCIPRSVRGRTKKSNRLSPMSSLLDRVREALFRLIMLSAISSSKPSSQQNRPPVHSPQRSFEGSSFPHEPHRSEAVADCIEFIKKSATGEENGREARIGGTAEGSDLVIPVPVM